ncbi:transposase [Sinorhizobium meliloti]|nr:transposase [Sinorhizobium meliloti]MDX0140703.1 transposase [Sinorhizobium meliloti]MDX0384018.1 transposase [Sinorhizobium meliloti]MQW61773.1 transposase [Sinorhizobium meliloti]
MSTSRVPKITAEACFSSRLTATERVGRCAASQIASDIKWTCSSETYAGGSGPAGQFMNPSEAVWGRRRTGQETFGTLVLSPPACARLSQNTGAPWGLKPDNPPHSWIEKIFGTWKRSYGLRQMRWRGLAKAGFQLASPAVAYNMKSSLKVIATAGQRA